MAIPPFPEIVALTTFAEDTMVYMETGEVETRPGGPGHWIKETYERLGVPLKVISSGKTIVVKMELIKGEPLPGKVYAEGSHIIVPGPIKAAGFLVNYLDNFDIDQVRLLDGVVLYDIANLKRAGEYRTERQHVPLPSADIRNKITIIKTNDEEFPFLPKEWVEEQKKERIFLHTLGSRGLDIWDRGALTHFDPPREKPKNVLGAGDTLGSSFLAYYLTNGNDSNKACELAIKEVQKLFIGKGEFCSAGNEK